MAIAFDPDTPFEFILAADRFLPEDQRTVFELKTLTARETAAVENAWRLPEDEGGPAFALNRGTMVLEILRRGLKGWRNFRDVRGKAIEFLAPVGGMCNLANLDRLTPEQRHEIARAIERGAQLSEGDRKN